MKGEFKFGVGQRVRRNKKWWKEEKPNYYGRVLVQTEAEDNNGKKKRAYNVQWKGLSRQESLRGQNIFLEEELEASKK